MKPLLLLLPAALAACAAYAPVDVVPGQSADQVAQSLGPPTGRYTLPDGRSRLEYARGPFGKHTWMIDLDAAGKVASVDQVLTEAKFGGVTAGMTREQVLVALGRPSDRRGAFRDTELWSYRYDTPFCQWFVVTMNPDGRVRDSGYVPDPLCDANDNGDFPTS
jgi:hypothetical protein